MQRSTYLVQMTSAISPERLAPYCAPSGNITVDGLANYYWNSALCEALYPILQCVEVTLRNNIHSAATASWGNVRWFASATPVLLTKEDAAVINAMERLLDSGLIPSPGDIVASLDFGFWTSLLRRDYDAHFWRRPGMVKTAFPHLPPGRAPRTRLAGRFNDIRRLRNRVFHHEPIWYRTDLLQQHDDILEAIGWMNEAARLTMIKSNMDRFIDVHNHGKLSYQQKLAVFVGSLPS